MDARDSMQMAILTELLTVGTFRRPVKIGEAVSIVHRGGSQAYLIRHLDRRKEFEEATLDYAADRVLEIMAAALPIEEKGERDPSNTSSH